MFIYVHCIVYTFVYLRIFSHSLGSFYSKLFIDILKKTHSTQRVLFSKLTRLFQNAYLLFIGIPICIYMCRREYKYVQCTTGACLGILRSCTGTCIINHERFESVLDKYASNFFGVRIYIESHCRSKSEVQDCILYM